MILIVSNYKMYKTVMSHDINLILTYDFCAFKSLIIHRFHRILLIKVKTHLWHLAEKKATAMLRVRWQGVRWRNWDFVFARIHMQVVQELFWSFFEGHLQQGVLSCGGPAFVLTSTWIKAFTEPENTIKGGWPQLHN